LELSGNYDANTRDKDDKIDYSPKDRNCNTWANSILKEAGIGDEERKELRKFRGLDIGEHKLLPLEIFQDPKQLEKP
jgi:hypothetical protein